MEYVNELYKAKTSGFSEAWQTHIATLVQLLAPFAPHMSAEVWQLIGNDTQIDSAQWPEWDESLTMSDTLTIVVQVNGKVRAKLTVAADASETEIKQAAMDEPNVQKFTGGNEPKKIVYVSGRLVSIVA